MNQGMKQKNGPPLRFVGSWFQVEALASRYVIQGKRGRTILVSCFCAAISHLLADRKVRAVVRTYVQPLPNLHAICYPLPDRRLKLKGGEQANVNPKNKKHQMLIRRGLDCVFFFESYSPSCLKGIISGDIWGSI